MRAGRQAGRQAALAEGRSRMCPPWGWFVLWARCLGSRGPALPWASCSAEGPGTHKACVGLTSALARLASQQFQQLLRVGLLWEFRGPGKRLGWAAGPSGSFRATRNTYVTVSEGRFDEGPRTNAMFHTLGWGWAWVPPPGQSWQQGPSLSPPLPLPPKVLSSLEEQRRGGHLHQQGIHLFAASPAVLTPGLSTRRSQEAFAEWTWHEPGFSRAEGLYRAGLGVLPAALASLGT